MESRRTYNRLVSGSAFKVSQDRDEVSVMSDGGYSKAESVASEALDAILDRMEQCKAALVPKDGEPFDINKQMQVANLLEKLASAAVAVKKLEELGLK